MSLGDGDARADVEVGFLDFFVEDLLDEVAIGVEGDNLGWVSPGRLEGEVDRGLCQAEVGLVGRGEGAHGDGEGAVDGVGPGVGTDRVAIFEGGGEARADDGPTGFGGGGTPFEGLGGDPRLVRVG